MGIKSKIPDPIKNPKEFIKSCKKDYNLLYGFIGGVVFTTTMFLFFDVVFFTPDDKSMIQTTVRETLKELKYNDKLGNSQIIFSNNKNNNQNSKITLSQNALLILNNMKMGDTAYVPDLLKTIDWNGNDNEFKNAVNELERNGFIDAAYVKKKLQLLELTDKGLKFKLRK